MPTIKNINDVVEPQNSVDYADTIVSSYPYKEYAIAKETDGSLIVSCPDGSKMRMPKSTLEYYVKYHEGGMGGKENYEALALELEGHDKIQDLSDKTNMLKTISRRLADVEHNPDSYSPTSYVMSQPNVDPRHMKSAYGAWATGDCSKLDEQSARLYSKALSYAFNYYKFLLGLFSMLG